MTNLIPVTETDSPFSVYEGPKNYKIYNDGRHYVATLCKHGNKRKPLDTSPSAVDCSKRSEAQNEVLYNRARREARNRLKYRKHKNAVEQLDLSADGASCQRDAVDILFDSLFFQAVKAGLRNTKYDDSMTEYIRAGILRLYPDFDKLDEFIEKKIKRAYHNIGVRKKRFRRKAHLNQWNYFVTFTYDDRKHSEQEFYKKLRKCLSNLHVRRGWKYMGVFERAPETGRLHFHGLIYVPDGEMIGEVTQKRDYDTVNHCMQTHDENSFFQEVFGRNDFDEISKSELQYGNSIDYILKYITKSNDRICYSRGIPSEVFMRLDENDIVTEFTDFVQKFVLFDNVVDWERDVLGYKSWKQVTVSDVLCNPLRVG